MLRLAVLLLALAPAGAQAQETLADIRAELSALGGQIAGLRSELTATGAGQGVSVAGTALERMDAIEAELTRLTRRTEEIDLKINKVVSDANNKLGDLEFRICEAEPGCDISTVGQGGQLGGGSQVAAVPATPSGNGAEMAVGEKADFQRAKEALDSGSFRAAADQFAAFAETYPGGPLTGEALYWRGEALMGLGDTTNAARSWLKSFSDDPGGPKAADSLLKLGLALNSLGQVQESCVTLHEVSVRYPGSEAAGQAMNSRSTLGCG